MSGVYPELDNLSLEELIGCFHGLLIDGPEYGGYYYDQVVLMIRRQGQPGNRYLMAQLQEINPEDEDRVRSLIEGLTFPAFRREGMRALAPRDKNRVRKWLRKYLDDQRPFIVGDAIGGLAVLNDEKIVERILALRDHAHYFVRYSVLYYMNKLYPERAFPMLLEALKDQEEFVREMTADWLAGSGEAEAIPHLRSLLNDRDEHVRESAQNVIESIESYLASGGDK